jgi:hypothetical protein
MKKGKGKGRKFGFLVFRVLRKVGEGLGLRGKERGFRVEESRERVGE